MLVSIVIRTLNEEKYLEELCSSIQNQKKEDFEIETVIIDSGSTDRTLAIAKNYGARITHISKSEFTFGRSLNLGTEFSNGDIIVYISGHCVPVNNNWLINLIKPLIDNVAGYSYGGQLGRDTTKYSEYKIFEKYFPSKSKIPQVGFFCNNANSALLRSVWQEYKFNEEITGLEDMELAKRYCEEDGSVAYVSEASVFHIHNESWKQTKRRYERESLALQGIMPEVQISKYDLIRYISVSIISDSWSAIKEGCFLKEIFGIVNFRLSQYIGTYNGNNQHRSISNERKEKYFYPTSQD